ncbi:MAG TPA: hypothetical protein VMU19_01770 [Bryobacteraceae bacterium]|nr:hypothetical protein [Bryobacteraceae bacterium]
MDALLWILVPGCAGVASAILAWFVMQSRMEVKLAEERERLASQRENLAETRGELKAEKAGLESTLQTVMRAAEETARRQALEGFLSELRVEQRHYSKEDRTLTRNRKSLVLQERMYFRGIPLSDWIEHEILMEAGADVDRLVQDMTVFDKSVVNIADIPRTRPALEIGAEALAKAR